MQVQDELAGIPYLAAHGLELVEAVDGRVRVCLRFRPELEYRPKVLHGGALYTAAEAAGGLAVWNTVAREHAVLLLRGATVRYLRRATGDVVGTGYVDPGQAEGARASFSQTGRAEVAVEVAVSDSTGQPVMEGSFRYSVRAPKARG